MLKSMARSYIKQQLTEKYSPQELSTSNYRGGVRKNKKMGKVVIKSALSPTRVNKIVNAAKTRYPQDFKNIDPYEVVNEKCRKTVCKEIE